MSMFQRVSDIISSSAYKTPLSRFIFFNREIQKIIKKEKLKGSYLDIGCNAGYASLILGSSFANIVNVDFQNCELSRCKNNCKNKPYINYAASDAQKLPFKNSSFDFITAFSLIEHLPNQKAFLEEVNRTLKKDGVFVMQVPNRSFFVELHTAFPLPSLLPRKFFSLYCEYIVRSNFSQVKNLTRKEARRLCQPIFKTIVVKECNYSEDNVPPKLRMLYKTFEKLGVLHAIPMGWLVFCSK